MKTTEQIIKENVKLDNIGMCYRIINKDKKWYSKEELEEIIYSSNFFEDIVLEIEKLLKGDEE